MNIVLLGGAGFIGTNLAIALSRNPKNQIIIADENKSYFRHIQSMNLPNVFFREVAFNPLTDFSGLFYGQNCVYHLFSTTAPKTSNLKISEEINSNVVTTANMLEACVKESISKVVFLSSGGTVYGKDAICPIDENAATNPISSYGIQKIAIEKLLYLYEYLYSLDYRIIRLANPYGPYQRPNGILGVITTFTYKALKNEQIFVYGDGTVIRDFIYIDDAIRGILNVSGDNAIEKIYNLGSGHGISVKDILDIIQKALGRSLKVSYLDANPADVPQNFLNISRYESEFGKLPFVNLEDGIQKTALFLKEEYRI